MHVDRLIIYGLTSSTRQTLHATGQVLDHAYDGMLEGFFEALVGASDIPQTAQTQQHLADARVAQQEHWRVLFSGQLGAAYTVSLAWVAATHSALNIRPSAYIAAYTAVLGSFHDVLVEHALSDDVSEAGTQLASQMMEAVDRAVLLDVDLISDIHAANSGLQGWAAADSFVTEVIVQMRALMHPTNFAPADDLHGFAEQPVVHVGGTQTFGQYSETLLDVAIRLEDVVDRISGLAQQTNGLALVTALEATRMCETNASRTVLARDIFPSEAAPNSAADAATEEIKGMRRVIQAVHATLDTDRGGLDAVGGTVVVAPFRRERRPVAYDEGNVGSATLTPLHSRAGAVGG
jgi:uncharacterized protein YwlG (UPF0340 family)